MKQHELLDNIVEQFKSINRLSEKIVQSFDPFLIAEFLEAIRKLRAFLHLLSESDYTHLVIPKKMKTFFGYMGILNNLHHQQQAILDYAADHKKETPTHYLHLLEQEKDYWKEDTRKMMHENEFKDDEDKLIEGLPPGLTKHDINQFLSKRVHGLKSAVADADNDLAIHNIRKILYDIVHALPLASSYAHLPAGLSTEADLMQMITLLSTFRTKCAQLNSLTGMPAAQLSHVGENMLLKEIEAAWAGEKAVLKDLIKERLQQLRFKRPAKREHATKFSIMDLPLV